MESSTMYRLLLAFLIFSSTCLADPAAKSFRLILRISGGSAQAQSVCKIVNCDVADT